MDFFHISKIDQMDESVKVTPVLIQSDPTFYRSELTLLFMSKKPFSANLSDKWQVGGVFKGDAVLIQSDPTFFVLFLNPIFTQIERSLWQKTGSLLKKKKPGRNSKSWVTLNKTGS